MLVTSSSWSSKSVTRRHAAGAVRLNAGGQGGDLLEAPVVPSPGAERLFNRLGGLAGAEHDLRVQRRACS